MPRTVPQRFHPFRNAARFDTNIGCLRERTNGGCRQQWQTKCFLLNLFPFCECWQTNKVCIFQSSNLFLNGFVCTASWCCEQSRILLISSSFLRMVCGENLFQFFQFSQLFRSICKVRLALLRRACVHWLWYMERAAVSRMCSEQSVLHAGSVLPAGKGFCHSDSSRCSCR